MRRLVPVVFLFVAIVGAALAQDGGLRAGAAVVDLTPPGSVPLAGYGARFPKTSEGVHDPVHVRALALECDGRRFVVVSADLIGVMAELRDAVVAALPADLDLESKDILLAATHNHSGPGGFSKHLLAVITCGFHSDEVFGFLRDRTVEAIVRAVGALAPARLGVGTVDLSGFSRNRRVKDGPVDPEAGLVRVVREDGSLLAAWVHFAAHPTILGSENMLVSADWPGALCSALEAAHPGAAVLFTNGAEGDQRPHAPDGKDDWERLEIYGKKIAEKVESALPGIEVSDELPIESKLLRVELPKSALGDFAPRETCLQRVRLGDSLWLAVPGEPVVQIGLLLKERARAQEGTRKVFVVGLANDHLGYFASPSVYFSDAYESRMCFYGPWMGEFFAEHLLPEDLLRVAITDTWRRDVSGLDVSSGATLVTGRMYAAEIRAIVREIRRLAIREGRRALAAEGLDPVRVVLLSHVDELAMGILGIQLRSGLAGVDPAHLQAMRGAAAAAEVSFDEIVALNRIPDLVSLELRDRIFSLDGLLGGDGGPAPGPPAPALATVVRSGPVVGRALDVDFPILAAMTCVRVGPDGKASVGWPGLVLPAHADGPVEEIEGGVEAVKKRLRELATDRTILFWVEDPAADAFHVWRNRGALEWVRLDLAGFAHFRIPEGAKEIPPYGDASHLAYHHEPFEATVERKRKPGLLPGEWRVEFPSPRPSGIPENDRVYGYLYESTRPSNRAIVMLPIWKGPDLTLETTIGQILAARGYRVFVMPLAYQFERAPKGRSGDLTVSEDLQTTRDSWIQSVQDAQRAAWWLVHERGVAEDGVAVMGISLGGHVAAVAYGASEAFSAGVFLLAGGGVADVLWNDSDETKRIKRRLQGEGVTLSDLRGLTRDYDPLTFARPERGAGVYLAGGRLDEIVPPANVEALADAYGGAPIRWVPAGHYTAWVGLPVILAEIDRHLDRQLAKGR